MKITSKNSATDQVVWTGTASSPIEIEAKITSARTAFSKWSGLELEERIAFLLKFRDILEKNKEYLTETISIETGKPLWDSKTEVAACIGKIAISIEAFKDRCPEKTKDLPLGKSITRHRPHGVVAVFGPFNFPAHLPNGHMVPALLAGNTVIFKPSEQTPWVGQQLTQFWEEAELPEGVVNLVQGGPEVGKIISNHRGIDGLFFTGSWKTGQLLNEQAAGHLEKILALELGGNNPLIIGQINDLKTAAYITIQSALISSGQRCTCARRLIVPKGKQGDAFIEILVEMTQGIQVGFYNETPEPFMGPVISKKAAQDILETQQKLLQIGGRALLKMTLLKADSALLSPGLIDVTELSSLPDEEIFGPLLQIIRVTNLEEAIEQANNTRFGLSAGILTDIPGEYNEYLKKARAGIVNWNTQLTGASSAAPFGGIGHSGNHRPSAYYAADYCSYPVASIESEKLIMPKTKTPGINL